jgi:hypothetical protein
MEDRSDVWAVRRRGRTAFAFAFAFAFKGARPARESGPDGQKAHAVERSEPEPKDSAAVTARVRRDGLLISSRRYPTVYSRDLAGWAL